MSGWEPGSDRSAAAPRRSEGPRGRSLARIGRFEVTPIRAVVAIAFIGSSALIAYAVLRVRDSNQIGIVTAGFAVLGLSFVAMAVGALIEMWRAAVWTRNSRAMLLAIAGGLAGLAAIGCFTVTVILALVSRH
jgi:hypothetical protein